MSDSSSQPEPQSDTAISSDRVWKLINDKLFGAGIPTAFVALAIDRLRQSNTKLNKVHNISWHRGYWLIAPKESSVGF